MGFRRQFLGSYEIALQPPQIGCKNLPDPTSNTQRPFAQESPIGHKPFLEAGPRSRIAFGRPPATTIYFSPAMGPFLISPPSPPRFRAPPISSPAYYAPVPIGSFHVHVAALLLWIILSFAQTSLVSGRAAPIFTPASAILGFFRTGLSDGHLGTPRAPDCARRGFHPPRRGRKKTSTSSPSRTCSFFGTLFFFAFTPNRSYFRPLQRRLISDWAPAGLAYSPP